MSLNFITVIFLIYCVGFSIPGFTQIEELWLEPVDAIIKLDLTEFEIISQKKAIKKVHRIIYVFNEKGKFYGDVTLYSNQFQKINKIAGALYNLDGSNIKKLKKDDIKESQISPDAIYDQYKIKEFSLTWNEFPYKIEYNYEIEINTLFLWEPWKPQRDHPVLLAKYTLIIPHQIQYDIHRIGIDIEPDVLTFPNLRTLKWTLQNIEPRILQDYMPRRNTLQKALFFAPKNFNLGNTHGSFASWQTFAQWFRKLISGRSQLPPQAASRVHYLLDDADSNLEKIRKLYAFLQNSTRYVKIYLDIGGWQPHYASSVFENKYGDCKDLTMLMLGMLQEAGIKAYPALMNAGDSGDLFTEFPSNQFNHLLTCIPMETDTLWLECTADYCDAGDLTYDTEARHTLLIKENGGELVYVPASSASQNSWTSKIKGKLVFTGTLFLTGIIQGAGNQANRLRQRLIYQKLDKREDWIRESLVGHNLPKFDLKKYSTMNVKENFQDPISIEFEGIVQNFAAINSRRLFLNPNILNRSSGKNIPKENEKERVFPVQYKYAYFDQDSVQIKLPKGYVLEAAPEPQNIKTSFGHYQTDFSFREGALKYYRSLRIDNRIIPTDRYSKYKLFLKAVSKNDKANFVFKK